MATMKEDFVAKYQTTTDADVEEVTLSAGDEVTVVQQWDNNLVLIKDGDGHYHNLPQDKVDA